MSVPVVQFRPYDSLRLIAASFLEKHKASHDIPVPIERIVEIDLGIEIIPIPGLLSSFDIDAFISSSLTSITVDQSILETRVNRYRFSLAHEISHVVLHKDFFSCFSFGSIEQYKACLRQIDDRLWSRVEGQAYDLAGLILVPPEHLKREFLLAVQKANDCGISPIESWDMACPYIASWLAPKFEVSAEVVQKRINRDDLSSVLQSPQ